MGVHLMILRDGRSIEHPEFDGARYSGDRDLVPEAPAWDCKLDGEEWTYRPLDVDACKAALNPDRPNPDRLPGLINMLAADPSLCLYISY